MSDSNKERDAELLVISTMMQHQGIRAFMFKQLSGCGVYESGFNKDTHQHSFNAGMRQAGLQLEQELKEAAPGDYLAMIKENLE